MISSVSFGALPPKTHYVSKNLIVGASLKISQLRQLRNEEEVSRVIDLRNGRHARRLKEFLVCKLLGIDYNSRPMKIGDKLPLVKDEFEKIHSLISGNTQGKTFVHCNNGLHRSMLVAAFEEFKAGRIRSFEELSEFLKNGNYFKLRKEIKIQDGKAIKMYPEEAAMKRGNLEYQKRAFWKMVNA